MKSMKTSGEIDSIRADVVMCHRSHDFYCATSTKQKINWKHAEIQRYRCSTKCEFRCTLSFQHRCQWCGNNTSESTTMESNNPSDAGRSTKPKKSKRTTWNSIVKGLLGKSEPKTPHVDMVLREVKENLLYKYRIFKLMLVLTTSGNQYRLTAKWPRKSYDVSPSPRWWPMP